MDFEALLTSPLFKQVLFDRQTQKCDLLEASMEPVTFSPKFERKMERLLRVYKKPYYPLINTGFKKAVLAMAAIIILLTTMVFSVSALREPVVRFIVEVYEKFSQVFFAHQPEDQFPTTLEAYYAPTWLPEGYREDADQIVDVIIHCEWTFINETSDIIIYKQYIITSSTLSIDTEGSEIKPVTVNGNAGIFLTNKGIQRVLWNDGQYGFVIYGPISEADILRMAASIQAREK